MPVAQPTDTFESFKARALASGATEVLVREWPALKEVPEHRHDFGVDALVVEGEMWLQCRGETLHLLPGDTFSLDGHEPHAERYGPKGAVFWAARRRASPAPRPGSA